MTDWTNITRCAGPNPETFPAGEQVYLFCSMARLQPPEARLQPPEGGEDNAQWLRAFRQEAEDNGLSIEIRDTTAGYCLFVVVPNDDSAKAS